MTRSRFWTRTLLWTAAVLAGTAAVLHFSGKDYVYRALFHNFADIDDNLIFIQRTVEAPRQTWRWHEAAGKRQRLPQELRQTLEENHSIAYLVIRNDTVLYEEYWDGFGPDSKTNSFSVAKSIVGTLVGIAIRDGYIRSIDQPVGDFLPEYRTGGKERITIRHLLMMSSGLDWDEAYANPLSITTEAYYGTDLRQTMSRLNSVEEPGKRFTYKSGDTQLLGFVLEAATGQTLARYASERFWKRVGAEKAAEWSIDRANGDEKAYCCFFSNARDFARLGRLYLHQGVWNGDTLLAPAYVQTATTPHGLPDGSGKPTDYYGLQWWMMPEFEGQRVYYARGILGQYVVVVPDKNLIMVRLGSSRGKKEGNHYSDMLAMLRHIIKQY